MTVSELVVKLLFQSDKVKVDDFVKSVKELNLQSIVSLSAFGAMAVEMKNLMVWASQSALVMAKFQTETGLSAEQMQKWSNVASVAGISAQDAFQGVMALQKNLALVRMGMASPAPFAQMGINPSDDPFKVIKAFAEWSKTHRPVEVALMAERIGLPRSMMNMIKLTREEWTETEKLFKIDQNMIRANEGMRKEYEKLVLQLKQMGMSIATFAAPHLKNLIDILREFFALLSQHADIVIVIGVLLMAAFAPLQLVFIGLLALVEDFFVYLKTGESYLKPFYDFLLKIYDVISAITGMISKANSFTGGFGTAGASGVVPHMSNTGHGTGKSGFGMNQNTFHFAISGATSPEGVADKIRQMLQDVFSDVIYQDRKDNY